MHLAKPYVVIALVLAMLRFETDGQKACSCYSFEGGATGRMSWPQAKMSCEYQKKHLVVMETEREWEFIKNEIQNRTALPMNEWLIGLFWSPTDSKWSWVNGQPLTIYKWQRLEPNLRDLYGLIAENYPTGSYGSFGGIKAGINREWICEEETDNCTGTCMSHTLVATTATSISRRRTTTATSVTSISTRSATASTEWTTSATQVHTDLSDHFFSKKESTCSGGETTPGKVDVTGDKGDRTTVIVLAVSLATALIALAVVLLLKRKKGRPQDAERPEKKSSNPLEDQNEPILNPENAATQLGLSETEDSIPVGSNEHESNQEYTMLNPLTMTQGDKSYMSLAEGKRGISTSGACDESPTYISQMPLPVYMNAPV